jgi:hypothetical protein
MKATIHAKGTEIAVVSKGKAEFPADVVKNWLRTCSIIEYLGLWEEINNPSFKLVEFDSVKNEAGINAFVLLGNAGVKRLEGRK